MKYQFNLKKPLAFFDLETTGVDVGKDRIVEIAVVKVMPNGQVHYLPAEGKGRLLFNPEMPIPLESSIIHGIYDADVADAPTFAEYASKLFQFLMDCDLAGFNSNKFDLPLLAEEFLRAGVEFSVEGRNLVDVQVLFHLMEPRNLSAALRFYCNRSLEDAHEAMCNLSAALRFYCNRSLEDAHEAMPDVVATADVLNAMIEKYNRVPVPGGDPTVFPVQNDMELLHKLSERRRKADLVGHVVYNDENLPVFNFGKHKGTLVTQVFNQEPGYYGWLMNADFPRYTKQVFKQIKESM